MVMPITSARLPLSHASSVQIFVYVIASHKLVALEVMRCCSACAHNSCFVIRIVSGNALRLQETRWGFGNVLRFWIEAGKKAGEHERKRMSWMPGGDDSGFCLSLASMRVWKRKGGHTRERLDMCGDPCKDK